jgi:hypothetical protein
MGAENELRILQMRIVLGEKSGVAVPSWSKPRIVNFMQRLVASSYKTIRISDSLEWTLVLVPCSAMAYDVDEFVSFWNRGRRFTVRILENELWPKCCHLGDSSGT